MRRRFLPLLVPVIAASVAAPLIAAASTGSAAVAKAPTVTSLSKTAKAPAHSTPLSRRWL